MRDVRKMPPSPRSVAMPGAPPRSAFQRAARGPSALRFLVWIGACFVRIGPSFRWANSHVSNVKNRDRGFPAYPLTKKLAVLSCSQLGIQAKVR
jgi:hypothetical protein